MSVAFAFVAGVFCGMQAFDCEVASSQGEQDVFTFRCAICSYFCLKKKGFVPPVGRLVYEQNSMCVL